MQTNQYQIKVFFCWQRLIGSFFHPYKLLNLILLLADRTTYKTLPAKYTKVIVVFLKQSSSLAAFWFTQNCGDVFEFGITHAQSLPVTEKVVHKNIYNIHMRLNVS